MKTVAAFATALGALAAITLLAPSVTTVRPAAAVEEPAEDVVVFFHGQANLERGRGFHRRDLRAMADPETWDYLDRAVGGTVQELEVVHRFLARHVYSHAIRGFAARLTARQMAALASDPRVAHVEVDHLWTRQAQTLPWGVDRVAADQSSALAGNGSGAVGTVNVYVLDTGIGGHADLNVVRHATMDPAWTNTDCHGHGTHVAGIVGARDNVSYVVGVSPGVALTGVKVLGCGGSAPFSTVVKGIDWVTANARRPAIVNLSLGGPPTDAGDAAVLNSVASGLTYVVAAGNGGTSACSASPARLGPRAGVITVAATDRYNREPWWSNYGPCVDVWAPGTGILSTRLGGGTTTMTGTSMAAPHVTGAAALYQATFAGATPAGVENAVKTFARSFGTFSKDGRSIRIVNVADF